MFKDSRSDCLHVLMELKTVAVNYKPDGQIKFAGVIRCFFAAKPNKVVIENCSFNSDSSKDRTSTNQASACSPCTCRTVSVEAVLKEDPIPIGYKNVVFGVQLP